MGKTCCAVTHKYSKIYQIIKGEKFRKNGAWPDILTFGVALCVEIFWTGMTQCQV
jgi:hypothetical protein